MQQNYRRAKKSFCATCITRVRLRSVHGPRGESRKDLIMGSLCRLRVSAAHCGGPRRNQKVFFNESREVREVNENKETKAAAQDSEFSLSAVPESERKSYISLTIIWTGFVFVIVSMMAGGTLAVGLDFKHVIYATLIGNVFLCLIAVAVSVIASKTGLTFALLTRYSFGTMGSKLASIFVPIVNIGWYTIQAATYGHFVATALGLGEVGEAICMVLSAIAMGAFAFYGVKAITILGYVAIPAIVFLSIATTIRSMGVLGSWEALMAYRPSAPITLAAGVTTVIGAWILSTATCIADIMRYARSTKEAVASALTGLLFGNILMIVCGAIATIAMNDYDLTNVLLGFGLVIPALILMTTNIFTTNVANLYSTSLNLANSFKAGRSKTLIVVIAISALATLLKPYQVDFFYSFLNVLGNIVPPLAGIILADYFIIHRGRYTSLESAGFVKWNAIPWISWIVSAVLVYVIPWGLPSLNSLVLGALLYTVLMLVTGKNNEMLKREAN